MQAERARAVIHDGAGVVIVGVVLIRSLCIDWSVWMVNIFNSSIQSRSRAQGSIISFTAAEGWTGDHNHHHHHYHDMSWAGQVQYP